MLEPSQSFVHIDQNTLGMFDALIKKLVREGTRLPRETIALLNGTQQWLNRFKSDVTSYEKEAGHAFGVVDRMGRAGRLAYDTFGRLVAQTNALAQHVDMPMIELPAEVRAVVRSLHQGAGQTVAHNDGVGRFVQGLPHAELENAPKLPEIGNIMSTAHWREKLPGTLRSETRTGADQIEESLREFGQVARRYEQAQDALTLAVRDFTASPPNDLSRREEKMEDAWGAARNSLINVVTAFDSLAIQMPSIERTGGRGQTFGAAGRELANAIRQQEPAVNEARAFLQRQQSRANHIEKPPYTHRPAAGDVTLQLRPRQRVPRNPPPSYVAPPAYSQNLPAGHRRR